MGIAKSQISKKVLSWALVFALVVSFTPTIGATHEEDYINVENAVFPIDDDGLANDLAFLSHVADDEIGNITINVWKKNAFGNWEEYDDGETNETGELTFFNATSGEYMWDAYDGNNKIENEGGFAVINTLYSVSHVGLVNDFDGDDDTDDFIAYIFENNETSEDGYVEIYDDGGNLFDYGYTDEELDDNFTVFLASNLDRGNYTHYIYEEYNGTLIQNGSFYSYGDSTTTSDDDYDEWFDDWDYDVDPSDTIKMYFDPDTNCECYLEVSVSYGVYDNETGDFIEWGDGEHYEIYGTDSDWFDQSWVASENGSYDFYVYMIDENGTLEDDFWIYNVSLVSDDNGTEESDEWFEDRDYYTEPSDTIHIEYDPNTDCYCEVRVWVYIDVYQDGDKIDTIADDYYIYYTDDDWFDQDWTAEENDTYDFKVVLFDGENGPDNYEDEFWIYDVYLGSGNDTEDDEESVDHFAVIDENPFDDVEDGNVDDYIGGVFVNDSTHYDSFFEIYSDDDSYVDSGNPSDADYGYFVSNNLSEGWYHHYIYYDEVDYDLLQKGMFYSYGESSNFSIINVENIVDGDSEVEFRAHKGPWDEGVEDVTINIWKYNNDTNEWDDYATLYTDSDGFASDDQSCGEYEWVATYDGEDLEKGLDGYYQVWNECDFSDDGENETEDYDEWFEDWDFYGNFTEDDEHIWNKLNIGFDVDTECDCDIEIYVEAVIWDEDGNYVTHSNANLIINSSQSDWFELELEVDAPGKYWFTVDLHDDDWNHEDHFNFSLIMSDEWFEVEEIIDGNKVQIHLVSETNYDREMDVYYDFVVYNEAGEELFWDGVGSTTDQSVHFEWEAEESGIYYFDIYMYDEYENMEDRYSFDEEMIANSAPVIHGINTEQVFEGQMFNFEVEVTDENGDNLEFSWDMGDGTLGGGPWGLHDNSIMYVYPDDGEYIITVMVSDGNGGRAEESFTIWVMNTDPTLQMSYDDFGQEGQTLSFTSQTNDVPDDEVLVTWTFPDGTQVEGNFVQYRFVDDGEFMIGVTAEDEDGGRTSETLVVTIENVAPIFTEFQIPSTAQEGETLDFTFDATDPGDDTIVFNIDFGDGTAPTITQDGNVSHRFAEGDSFTLVICAKDEDGGETCRQQILPVSVLEQLEEEGLLPGFNLLLAISALGVVGMLRRRTH